MKPLPAAEIEEQLRRYLVGVAAGLHGPRRTRARILAELRDGLDEAVADHAARGLPPERAVAAATAQFGSPGAVTAAFAGELATVYARHTLAWYVATGPLVGIWWLFLLRPDPWRASLVALIAAIPVLPLIAIAVVTALGALAGTGRLMRWLPEADPRRALAATLAVALLATAGDAAIIGIWLRSAPARPLAVVAVAASLTRLACSLVVGRRASALRHRLSGDKR
jgi:hypothetical protein